MRKNPPSTGYLTLISTQMSCSQPCPSSSELRLISLSHQWLYGKLILSTSRTSLQLLALSLEFSPTKQNLPLEGTALPHYGTLYLFANVLARFGNLPRTSLSLPLSHCFGLTESPPTTKCCYSGGRFPSKIECSTDLVCLLQAPLTSSYNPPLRLQQPRLSLNRWLRLTRN